MNLVSLVIIMPLNEKDLKSLVSAREIVTESFLSEIIDSLPDSPNSSAVELARIWKEEAKKKIANLSVSLSHRVQPIVQLLLERKLAATLDQSFSTIETFEPSVLDLALKYQRCFNIWVDAEDCVSFKALNTKLLGKVNVKDMYILTFFAFLTCKRAKNDNILQLGLVGCSTSGKSTLFEACLLEGSHVTTNESGVGRFQVGNKPVLMFHDIAIRTLVMSKDADKIKTIARTEPTVSKVYSTVVTLPPMFVFYSSNERLLNHKFTGNFTRIYASQVFEPGKKRVSDESLLAIQNRFIEAFVKSPPPLCLQDLPQSGGFQRIHAILGLFKRILWILQNYKREDFYSIVLVQYVLHGLCANSARYCDIFNVNIVYQLEHLITKLLPVDLQPSLLKLLK